MNKPLLISVVSPVYNAANIVDELVSQLVFNLSQITEDFEIILVEDASNDDSWEKIEANCEKDSRIVGIKLSRNFGQHYAITAGLDVCLGEWVVVMDCDLQDRPDQIMKLYSKALEGYDVVQGEREKRKDGPFKRLFSWVFYHLLAYLSGFSYKSTIANFGIYNRKVIVAIISMREKIRFFPTMVSWVGFSKTTIVITHAARAHGKSTYSFAKLIALALDIILAYSDKPLRIMIHVGLLASLSSFLYLVYNIYKYFSGQIIVMGYASLIISIWFLSGLLMLMMGIVGLYIGKTFESTKDRPLYIVDRKINDKHHETRLG